MPVLLLDIMLPVLCYLIMKPLFSSLFYLGWYCCNLCFLDQYVEKSLVIREEDIPENPSVFTKIWQAVQTINVREVYRLIVTSTSNPINTKYDDVVPHADTEGPQHDPEACLRIKEANETESCFRGWSILHLACHSDSKLMVELLLQFGADINMCDYHGRTPLHHCISSGKNPLAKFLLRR